MYVCMYVCKTFMRNNWLKARVETAENEKMQLWLGHMLRRSHSGIAGNRSGNTITHITMLHKKKTTKLHREKDLEKQTRTWGFRYRWKSICALLTAFLFSSVIIFSLQRSEPS